MIILKFWLILTIYLLKKKHIYLFLITLGLRCCMRAFFSFYQWGLLFVTVHWLFTAVASFGEEHRL